MTPVTPPGAFNAEDCDRMQRCLQLAQRAKGYTAPNPMVGAIVVKAGHIIGEGFHPKAGEPHAEVLALREAGAAAQGATVYVNLEPCNHYGRTPPCTGALIAAGVHKVVVGMVDPNPLVAGQGIERLRAHGIEVVVGVEAAACQRLNEAFSYRIRYQQPFGILKYAMTLDGKIASTTGHSAWITQPEARQQVHQLRAGCDAVIVGGNTVRHDNPHLTTHGITGPNPLRVVLSRTGKLPIEANLWQTQVAPTVVFTETSADPEALQRCEQLAQQGVTLVQVEHLSPAIAMQWLYDYGCLSVLWECGGQLAAQALQAQAIQKVWAFVAPKLIGGQLAPSPVGDLGITTMAEAIELRDTRWQLIGQDLLLEGYLPLPPGPLVD
ncbi:MAG: bifunctional diaminohydroxyphosphoribosylaminopyrimidine deaminase/5-amino-6-(5-phosphoribosylamino)uracil reductase RibD [Cyanobacteria bacterium P01_H01_bin.121]